MSVRLAPIALGAAWLLTSAAAADVISPMPASCPEGAAPRRCHGPPTCEVEECTSDEACGAGRTCQPRALCVHDQCCAGRACGQPNVGRVRAASASCASGEACARGACETVRVCVGGTAEATPAPAAEEPAPAATEPSSEPSRPPAAPSPAPSADSGGCRIAAVSTGAPSILVLLGLLLARGMMVARRRI